MRRTGLALLLVITAACSSGGGAKGSSSGAPTTASASSGGPTTTADPALLSDLDRQGAKAFLTLFADGLHRLDPTITQAEVDCIPDAVLAQLTPQQLFTLVDRGLGALTTDQAKQVDDALRSCGLSDDQVAKARIG